MKFWYLPVLLLLLTVAYVVGWNVVVRYGLMGHIGQWQLTSSQPLSLGEAVVPVSASVEVLVMKWGLIPVFWTRLGGSLYPIHFCFLLSLVVFTSVYVTAYICSEESKT